MRDGIIAQVQVSVADQNTKNLCCSLSSLFTTENRTGGHQSEQIEAEQSLLFKKMRRVCELADCEAAAAENGRCSQCKLVDYCSKEHQKADWARHKPECFAASEAPIPVAPAGHWAMNAPLPHGTQAPPPNHWSIGLSPHMQREWLVDCYRMRLDDEMVWQNSIRPGSLYDQSAAGEIAQDFLVFCCLAKRKGALPENWNWPKFLDVAAGLLAFKFEKSDAKIKYGGENQFDLLHGGRSLRWVASAR